MGKSRLLSNIRLGDAVERFIARIEGEGQHDATVESARFTLKGLSDALGVDRWVHSITAAVMDNYCYGPKGIRQGASGAGLKAVSFNRYRSVLMSFFDYAVMMDWTDVTPMRGVAAAKPDMPTSKLRLSASELLALLDHCHNPIERVACSLGMNTGLRANDIRHLTVFDVSLSQGVIQTEIRKTSKLDSKPITMDLHRELTTWLDTYARLAGLANRSELPNEYILVPSYTVPPPIAGRDPVIRPHRMLSHPWRLVQRPIGRMGYDTKGTGFHTLRRSSARAFFESLRDSGEGRDHALMIVKDFLNHGSTAQTEHYLGLNQERTIRDSLLRDQPFLSGLAQAEQARVTADNDDEGKVRRLGA
jgi:integrase